ncbi:hypothetical protein HAX54_001805 [Datura stramonium]|uniref:Uncharacterized protein n=1 Tax=Datura stramonium TaxID=4076 RepID=A0ABS8WQW4_DATST|nr:hypothetical protein [Datura stramonium]
MFPIHVSTSPVQKIADVLRLTEQSLAAISKPITKADGQEGLQRGRQTIPGRAGKSLASAIKSSVSEDTLYFGSTIGASLECAYLSLSSITF